MREIIFKGKTLSGNWVQGNLSILKEHRAGIQKGSYISNDLGAPFAYHIRPETICQKVDVTDATATNYWEGDIVQANYVDAHYRFKIKGIVRFREGSFIIEFKSNHTSSTPLWDINGAGIIERKQYQVMDFCIIGNIHDNPELLNQTTQ